MSRSSVAVRLFSVLAVVGPAVAFGQADGTLAWRESVWTAALDSKTAELEALLAAIPTDADASGAKSLQSIIEARDEHRRAAQQTREEAITEAKKALADAVADEDLPEALFAAVKVQSLSEDWSAALDDEVIQTLIADADALASSTDDLLLSQELLFRLRMLHDDKANRPEAYLAFDARLEAINRGLGLMARYSPRYLHELRRRVVERRTPDEEFPPFNEAFAKDWKEELRGITQPMVKASLRTAATEHVSKAGWQPLLDGGLEALDLLVSTDGMEENFQFLSQPKRVEAFKDMLTTERAALMEQPARIIDRRAYNRIIAKVLEENLESVMIPEQVLLKEFGEGATYRLEDVYEDNYTQIIWPQRLRRFQQQVQGEFVGVGILIRHDDKREIMIVNPLEGSPAARSGIEERDLLVSVNGVPTTGWSLTRAVDEITGPSGEVVNLEVRREGEEETLTIPIVRDVIKIRSVNGWWKESLGDEGTPNWEWFLDKDAGIGYIRLTSFNEDSFRDFLTAVEQLEAEGDLKGLIFDIRHNPGGLLDSAVSFSNLFVEDGTIVSCQDRDQVEVWTRTARPHLAKFVDLPVVVLVNQGSASASEIVSGCLQAHDAAIVLGERTFGKGSVQSLHDVSDRFGQAALKLTTQYYALPPAEGETTGRLVHKTPGDDDWGVNPDLLVEMDFAQIDDALKLRKKSDMIIEWETDRDAEERPRPDALLSEGLDPQLEMALLLLRARLLEPADPGRLVILE